MLKTLKHYYGDVVRFIFMFNAVILMLGMTFFKEIIPIPFPYSLYILLGLAFFAGFTSPTQRWVSIIDVVISAAGAFYFQYHAFNESYMLISFKNVMYFWINQLVAVLFFIALYFAIKTARGMIVEAGKEIENS